MPIHFTDDPGDMALVNGDPFALLTAMVLDQQFSIAAAFQGPNKLRERLDGRFDAATIAAMSVEEFVAVASIKPAIHRFPKAMAARIHELATVAVDEYNGDIGSLWAGESRASVVAERLASLPGFGPEKVKITIAVLVKRFDMKLSGWRELAKPFGDDEPRSVADIGDADAFVAVKAWKKAQKARGLDKDGSARTR